MRLFSVQWFVQGLITLATAAAIPQTNYNDNGWYIAARIIPSIAALLAAIISWFIAPPLSRLIAGKYNAPVEVSGLSLLDLYSFGFVFLGLYFVLSSLADVLNWLYYSLVIAASHGDFDPERKKSLYGLLKPLITMAAGFVCLISGRRWAKKLSDKAD
jgi:hypothetical protein